MSLRRRVLIATLEVCANGLPLPDGETKRDAIIRISQLHVGNVRTVLEPFGVKGLYGLKDDLVVTTLQLEAMEAELSKDSTESTLIQSQATPSKAQVPDEICGSLARFRSEHPDPSKTAFVMMQFGASPGHRGIVNAIKDSLASFGIAGLRADDHQYHDDLFSNVLTYIYGCGFGIAVFERLESDVFNANVSLEVGYMMALSKPTCLLKDKTLPKLTTDLAGKLYRQFDPQLPGQTIPSELERWMESKQLIPRPKRQARFSGTKLMGSGKWGPEAEGDDAETPPQASAKRPHTAGVKH